MNFKKILGSILSTMSLFTAQSAFAVDITNEATLNDYMTNKESDKQTGVIQNDITTTAGITSSNSDVSFQALGNRVLSGALLSFTGANGKLTLSIVGGDTFTINNTISLDGTTLTNSNGGTYNFNNILGTGTLNLTSGAKFNANNVTANLLSIAKDTSLTLNDGTITTVQLSGNSATLNVQNLLNASTVSVSNYGVLNVTDMYVSSTLVGNSNSTITAMKMVDGLNTGAITVEGEFSLGNSSSAYADKVTANKVTLTSNSSLDLVGDDATASKNGVLTVSDTLNIGNGSTVKANTVNAKTIVSDGKLIIGKDGTEVSYINTDAMTINKGDYTNTVIKGLSSDYSNISFASGGTDINFNGELNEIRVKGGSTSSNATVTINDDSKLKIAAGDDESSKGVQFNGTIFNVGDNSELNIDAVSSDITFSSGNKMTGISLGDGSVINVSSSGSNTVTIDNINHDTDTNIGTLNIMSGANVKTTAGIKGSQWVSGQIYVDKYIQNAGSTMTMLADSAINANVVTINGGKLALTGTSSTTTSDMSSVKDTIRAKTSFTAKQATITSSGLTQIISNGAMTFTDSGITVNSGSNSILSLSAKEGVNFSSSSHIILNGGELRIFGNNDVVNKINGSIDNAKNQKGTLRKVGSSQLELGTEGVTSSLNVDTVIIGEDKVFSGTADPVGSGLVTVKQVLNTDHFIVAGDSTVDVNIVKANEEAPDTLGSTNAGSEISFKRTGTEIKEEKGPVLNLIKGTLIADVIDLSVKEANLDGGVIGIEDGGTSKVIFGNKSKINVKSNNAVKIYVDNAAKGGFSAQGAEINLENRGSLVFGSAVGSQAHWNIKNENVVQRFKAESWFDGIRLDDKIDVGGIFNNKGSIIIGDYTNFGFNDGDHPLNLTGDSIGNHVGLRGGAIYNEGFFGSYTLEGTANDVKFTNNSAASYVEEGKDGTVVVTKRFGSGGAIYNTDEGIIALGTKTKFDSNGAGVMGGAIYNDATDSTYTIDGKEVDYNAITLGKDTWFTTNKAGRVGGAIYTDGGTISIGEKAAFDNNVVGLKGESSDIERNDFFFHNAEGGALYVAEKATVDIGAHSGIFNSFSSYSGGAISNHRGKLIFNDDGKIGDEPLQNGEIVKGSIRIEGGGKRNETKNGIATGNIFYTHQGGGLFNENGEIYTRRTNLDGSTYLQSGLYNAEFNSNQALFGGAIYVYNHPTEETPAPKQLVIENSTFTGNSANRGVEIFYDATSGYSNLEETTSSGGAIYNAGHKVSYTLEDGASGKQQYVKKNVEYSEEGSDIKVKNSTFTGNTASNKAGAIYNDISSKVELSDSTFDKNSATQGGAIYNTGSEEHDGTIYIGATIFTNLGEKGEKIIMNSNTATRQMSGKDETSPSNEFLGGAIYNAGTIKQKDSTSSYNNEIIGFEFNNNSAGAGQSTSDPSKSTIGRGGAYYNAASGTTYVGNSKFDGNFTYAFAKDGEELQSEGGAIYNEKGTLIIGESQDYDGTVKGVEFTNNGINANSEVTTNRGGAIYNAAGATTIVESTKTKFSGNSAIKEGGAIYNATGATLEIKDGVSIGSIDDKANNAKLGGGVFNAGSLKLAEGTSFVNNTAFNGGGLYLKKGSTVNADAAGLNHLSKVTFEGNSADYGAGLFVDEGVDIYLDNVMFKGNSTSGLGSAFYNQGKLTLGENNTFFNNSGSLIGNSGELIFTKNFTIDGSKKGNEGNTSFITNEENGVVKITTENGTSLDINAIGNGTADGAAISLLGKSTITTDGVAKTLKNAIFTKNKGKNGGAIYKESTEDLTIDNTKFDGNNATAKGGAIYNAKGSTITIGADTTFTNNNANVAGGAIYNAEGGTLTFAKGYKGFANANSKNYSSGNGGAISNDGVMNIYYDDANPDSIIFSNQGKDLATGNGGALHLGAKSIVKTNDTSKTDSSGYEVGYIKNGVFSNNTANNGGALFNESNLVIEDTMFTGNKSGTAGGAIYNKGNVIDGRDYGILDIILSENKTLYNNKSDDKGGAIYNEGGTVNIIAKSGSVPTISGNTAHNQGGVVASDGGVINVGGNIKFKDNGTVGANSKGGVFSISSGTLNLDTTDGDIVFDNNTAAIGSAIYVENGGKINFKGDDTHGITFSKTQTVASDSSSTNQMNVAGGNIKFESSLAGFTGQFTQTGGTFTLANDFMNLNGTHNEVTGGKFILSDGAKLMPTTDTEDNKLNINGATIRFENNDSSKLTDLSVLYQYKDTTKNSFSNAGSTLTYTSDKGDAKIGLTDAKLDLALTQKFVDVVDEQTGEKYRKNSGEYSLILSGGADKNIDIAKDGRHAVSDLTVGDAVQIATDIKISNGGKLSLEGAGLSKDVGTIDLSNGGQLNIFNDTYEKTVDGVLTKYNTDLTFYGDLIGDATSKIYKGYKTSPLEDGLAGRASLIFASGASAADYMGSYIQNAGTLEFLEGSTYFNHLNSQVSYVEDAKLILNDGVIYTGDTTINFDGKGGKFVLGSATNIDMTHNPTPPPTNEKIVFEAKDKDGNKVTNTVKLGKDTTVQVTHGETNVDASDEIINIGKNNAFSGIIVGGDEDSSSSTGAISIKVSTEGIEGKDTTFNVEDNGKLGFGDVKFVDSTGTDVTGTYSPTVKLGTNSEFYLVSGRDNDFSNLNLSTKATEWSKDSGNLIKENASKTTLTGAKTDLSGFHGTITIKNGQIALGDDITEDKKFGADTKFDLSKLANGATVIVDNITQNNDMTLINGIGNEIIGTPTGDEFYRLKITNDKGSIKFTTDGTQEYVPDMDVKNGSILAMEAKGDIEVGDVDVTSKFSTISGAKQESVGGLKSDGSIKTGEIKVIGEKSGSEVAKATLVLDAGGDIATGDERNGYKNITVKYGDLTATSTDGSITFGDAADKTNPALSVINGSAYIDAGKDLTINGDVTADGQDRTDALLALKAKGNITADDITASNLSDIYIRSTEGSVGLGDVTLTNVAVKTIDSTTEQHASVILADKGSITVKDITLTDMKTNPTYIQAKDNISTGKITLDSASINMISKEGSIAASGNVKVTDSKLEMGALGGTLTFGDATDTTNPALDVANGSATILAKSDIKGNGNIKIKDSDLIIKSDEGKVTFGEVTDTTNPALSVVNGSAYVVAKDALTMNGDVVLDSLTKDSLITGSSVSMGSLTSTNNAERTIAIGATDEKLTIAGDVTVDDTNLLQISGAKGIDIKATGTKKGDVTITDSKFAAIADTGNINIDGNVLADNSVVSIVVRDSGTGNITIGNNSTTTPALSIIDSSAYISSEGLTTINGDVLMDNLADLAYISGNSVDIKGDVSIKNSKYASTIYAQDGNLTLGALDVVNNVDPDGKNAKTTIASNGGDIIAKGKLNVEDADIWMSANGAMKIASETDGTGVAVKVKGGKAEIFSSDDMVINGDVDISEITDESRIQGGSVTAGKINIHDNDKDMIIMSTVGNISTKDISIVDNNGKLTAIQAEGGITTNNGKVDVANSNLQMVAKNGDINLGTGSITIDNSQSIISATNGGIKSGDITVRDTVGGETPTELGMAAKDGSISSGNIDLSSNVSLKQITTKTVGSTAAADITNGNIKIADNAKYQANSAGNYTAGDIIANVAEGSESIATILADGNITIKDITAANLADLYIRSKEGDIMAGDIDLTNVAIDKDEHTSVILAENGAITVKDITLTDMAINPTYIQAKNDLSSGSISLKNADANIISTDGDVTATGNVIADTSKIIMSAGGALTIGSETDVTNPALKVNDGSATIIAKKDITAKGNINASKADLIIYSEEGGITLGEETDLTNPALKVANGSAEVLANGGALNIKGDVDMTTVTADVFMQGKSVAMENLKLYDNTKDTIINATEGDVSIKSITLTNNKETVDGKTTNKTITINATGGSINVDKDITVASSNLTMMADGGIKGNDLAISDSKTAPKTEDDPYDYGTVISSGTGDIDFNKVTSTDSVVAINSTSGNINIDKALTVTDVNKLSQMLINTDEGSISIGKGLTPSSDGSSVNAISAGENTYVVINAGKDITIGNNTAKTDVKVTKGQMIIKAENDGSDPAVTSNINAAKTDFIATSDDGENPSVLYVIGKDDVSVGSVTGVLSEVAIMAENGKLTVNGDVSSAGSATTIAGGDKGIEIKGAVTSINNAGTSIQATGDVKVGKSVSFTNNVTSANQINMNVDSLKKYQSTQDSSTTTPTTIVNNDTPNADVNDMIGKIQEVRSDAEYDSLIDGKNVKIGGALTAKTSNVAIGGRAAVSGLEIAGATSIDNAVVMINSSGDVVTNGFNVKDSIVTVQSDNFKANNMSVTADADSLAYLEMINNTLAVDKNMTAKNAIINSKYTTNIAVGGAGDFNTTVLNIPNANAQFGSLKTENTMVNLQNNQANNTISVTGDYTVAGNNLFYMDFDPATGAYDRVHVGGAITGADGATITVNSNLVNKGDVANGYQIYDVFQGNNGVSGVNFGLQGETAYSTALANYQMESLGSGKYAFKRTGYTPTALVNPVAVQLGGFLTQVQTYDTAFDNLDMVMMLPMTAYGPNRYAVEDEEAMVYSPLFIPELEKGVWFRPFANFENVDMHQVGGRVDSQTYGALVGGDTALKDLGNGYQGMMSAYVGYTGAHQDLDGVSNYQNGGVVGVTGAIYKNGFFSGLTVSANASGNSASTPYGSNDFFMLSAGAASKTGYNWELANGRFIIQPSWLMSYTFANVFDPNDIAGMKVDSSALHAVQLAPGLKFIGNFPNGWQPYLTVDYRFNICDNADYKVGVVDLPDARVKSYIEYGLGMQKRWGDRFTGYGQFLGRGIGRNGVGLNLGMRWMVGDGRNPR